MNRPPRNKRPSRSGPSLRQQKKAAISPLELTDQPRLAVFKILKEIEEGRAFKEALDYHGRLLAPRDLGLTTALVYEIIRHQSYLNWLMKSRLTAGRASSDLVLLLQIGLAQLLYFDRLGEHAIVSEAVRLTKVISPSHAGLVNGLLRELIREREAGRLDWPPKVPAGDDIAANLATTYSYPKWLVQKLLGNLGAEETRELLKAGNEPPPPTLRVNPTMTSRELLQERLPFPTVPTVFSPWGLKLTEFQGRPELMPGFAEGHFAIQDEASQLVGLLAEGIAEDAKILDLCAGLGGKALHLAALKPKATVFALDKDAYKLEMLETEARRLGLDNIFVKTRDLLNSDPLPREFDLVLLDAPCSGLGVIRRRPDLKWQKSPDDISRLASLQKEMLAQGALAVKPGGRLLYGVCSFTNEEGPEVVEDFLAQHSDFCPTPPEDWPLELRAFLSPASTLTLWPHRQAVASIDGFFWASFRAGRQGRQPTPASLRSL